MRDAATVACVKRIFFLVNNYVTMEKINILMEAFSLMEVFRGTSESQEKFIDIH